MSEASDARTRPAGASARRPRVLGWGSLALALAFASVVLPIVTAERWIGALGDDRGAAGAKAPLTVRVPPFAGLETPAAGRIGGDGGGVVVARGEVISGEEADEITEVRRVAPTGAMPALGMFLLTGVFAALFSHHTRRSPRGRLVRVQIVNLALVAVLAAIVKIAMLVTPSNILIVPVAMGAIVPTLVLDRVVGLATGTLAALIVALCVPFDVNVAVLLLVPVAVAGLVVAERPRRALRPVLAAGATATLLTALTYPLLRYLTTGQLPVAELHEPLRSAWVAAAAGPPLAIVLSLGVAPLYQRLVGEITLRRLAELDDLSRPLLRQIREKAPGSWQQSLMIANLAEAAANAIGANARLVRVGALYHDLYKSLAPKYFAENLEPGETSPYDQLPPEASRAAILTQIADGIAAARKAGLHERVIDFMHLDPLRARGSTQGDPRPQGRETAIFAICDAVEAASRTLKRPDPAEIDALVQRIVYGELHLGRLDDSGLSMSDLREIAASLRETIRLANPGRIDDPGPRDDDAVALAATDGLGATPKLRRGPEMVPPPETLDNELANSATAPIPLLEKRVRPAVAERAATGKLERRTDREVELQIDPQIDLQIDPGSSGDGADRAEHSIPSDGDGDTGVRVRANRRTNETGSRNRDFAAAVLLDPLVKDAIPSVNSNVDRTTARRPTASPADPSATEIASFAIEATRALRAAAPDLDVLPAADAGAVIEGDFERARTETASPLARKRAATVPPISPLARPPTILPPLRRTPTVPPPDPDRPIGRTLFGNAGDPRTPAKPAAPARAPGRAAKADPRADETLDDELGGDTPTRAPSRAELQALLDGPPDTTRQQSIEEIERLQRDPAARRSHEALDFAPPAAKKFPPSE